MSTPEITNESKPVPVRRRKISPILLILLALLLVVAGGATAGYFSGQALHEKLVRENQMAVDVEQFRLAEADFAAGKYRLAVTRLEEILKYEPAFPGAAELRERALAAMNATPTPQPTNTQIPSPTPDAPRAEQMLAQAKQQFVDGQYSDMIRTLLTLKVEIPDYQPERVDGLMWVALRFNGVHLLKDTNRLTEGMFYLDLARNYAPLDKEALDQMEAAKNFLFVYQSAYYYKNKDIEVSLKYFNQAVSIRPYFTERLITDYADIIVQNADGMVGLDACRAWGYYEEALRWVPNYEPAIKGRDYAIPNCGGGAPVPFYIYDPNATPTP